MEGVSGMVALVSGGASKTCGDASKKEKRGKKE